MPKHNDNFIAIFSDIHANIDALDAVLADIEQYPVNGMLCLGDIVGYGPEPSACVQRVMEKCKASVLGNHEAMLFLADKPPHKDWDTSVRQPLQLATQQLSNSQKDWLHALPLSAHIDPIALSHASLNEPSGFHYFHNETEAKAHFAAQPAFISFNGHTHVPAIWEENPKTFACSSYHPVDTLMQLDPKKRYSVNVGSVGQPRDADPRASYMLYDSQQLRLISRRIPYDISRAQARFKKAGLPARNAERLTKGE